MNKCIGCGAILQNKDKSKIGYINNINDSICERCFKLKHYGEYTSVSLNNEDYNKIINNIPKDSLVLYISDILSLDLNNINRFKKVILVITKRDIMPKSIKDDKIINYIKKNNKNILDIIIISSNKNYNIDNLYNIIKKYKNNKIYLVGNTNSGKSTLINKLIHNYTDKEDNITTSMYPSTTLREVEIKINDITLIDTPGLIDNNNIVNYLSTKDLKIITPKKEIKPKSCQIKGKGSILIGSYARINYNTKDNNSIVIYVSNLIPIKFASLSNNNLLNLKKYNFNIDNKKDIVIPGLGFIKCTKELTIDIYIMDKVVPYIRDNLI